MLSEEMDLRMLETLADTEIDYSRSSCSQCKPENGTERYCKNCIHLRECLEKNRFATKNK